MNACRSAPEKQRGVALLVFFMVVFFATASVFLTIVNNNVVGQQSAGNTVSALSAAKDTLISYAVLHGDYYGAAGAGPGHLPCPDTNNNGDENTPCNTAIGRLPESISIPAGPVFPITSYDSGIDQQIWYAVSDDFRHNPAGVLNTTSNGNITLDGQTNIAAVLMFPGEALVTQSRPNNNVANYLEASNAAGTAFISNNPADPENFNDVVLGISVDEIMSPVTARIAETIKIQLDIYHGLNGNYPPDSNLDDPVEFGNAIGGAPIWLANNNWDANLTYTPINADSGSIVFAGCGITYTLDVNTLAIAKSSSRC